MRVAVVNLKGGTGKTTTAVHLACGLAERAATLLVDADPQGSALSWSEAAGGLACPVVALPVKDLHRRLPQLLAPPVVPRGGPPRGRAGGLEGGAADGGRRGGVYEHVVIDTPPGHPGIVASALRAVDLALVPVQPSVLDLDRVTATLELIADAQALGGEDTGLAAAVLLTRTRSRTRSLETARAVLEDAGLRVLAAEVPQREALAAAFGDPVRDLGVYAPVVEEVLVDAEVGDATVATAGAGAVAGARG